MAATREPGFDERRAITQPLLVDPDAAENQVATQAADKGGENNVIDPDSGFHDPGDGPRNWPDFNAKVVPDEPDITPVTEPTDVPPVGSSGADGIDASKGTDPLLAGGTVTRPDDSGLPTATTRTVGDNELVENRLSGLLAGDSKYMRLARQQGLELGGGLGGSVGIQAAYGAAIAAGLPIAEADAQAYRDAASENMAALNEFGLANIQRRTSLDLGVMDANTRITTTHMNNVAQTNIAKMQDITNRDIANLDAETRVRVTAMNGVIQERLANAEFAHSQILNNEQAGYDMERTALSGEYNLATTGLQGEYNLEQEAIRQAQSRENNYIQSYMMAYDGTLSRIEGLNGLDIDDNARRRAEDAIWEGFYGMVDLIAALYPEVPPMEQPGG